MSDPVEVFVVASSCGDSAGNHLRSFLVRTEFAIGASNLLQAVACPWPPAPPEQGGKHYEYSHRPPRILKWSRPLSTVLWRQHVAHPPAGRIVELRQTVASLCRPPRADCRNVLQGDGDYINALVARLDLPWSER